MTIGDFIELFPLIHFLFIGIYSGYLARGFSKENQDNDALSGGQKAVVIVSSLINPLFGLTYPLYWWKRMPIKAKQASKYLMVIWAIVVLMFLAGFIFGFLSASNG